MNRKNWQKHRNKTAKAKYSVLSPHLSYSHEPSSQYNTSHKRVAELSEGRAGEAECGFTSLPHIDTQHSVSKKSKHSKNVSGMHLLILPNGDFNFEFLFKDKRASV